ncbi:MAG: universal stress protein [Coriobacteriia bacterium]|nr:universal stress protein [Coriobacteriia bacterium]
MQFRKIMIPFDGSEHSKNALDVALGLAGEVADAEIHVVGVVTIAPIEATAPLQGFWNAAPMVLSGYAGQDKAVDEALTKTEQQLVEVVRPLIEGSKCQVVVGAVAYSSPADGIIDYAERHECDLIIMGRRGLGKLRGMLGSVSSGVLANTDIPVLTVK